MSRWLTRLAPVITLGVLLGSGCVQDANEGSSPVASATAEETGTGCPNIDLRTPAGERIDLDGTWETEKEGVRGGIYYFRQVGACVWFAGAFPKPTDTDLPGPLGYVTVVFRGEVGSDFRVVGDWVDARDQFPDQPHAHGTMELRLDFTESGELRLTYVGGSGQPFIEPGYREEQSWIKISDGGAYPPPD